MQNQLRATAIALVISALAISLPAQDSATQAPNRLQQILAGDIPKSVDELRAMEAHHKRLHERVLPCTVSCNRGGSGVIVKGGFVLTCAHVTRRAGQRIPIILQNGKQLMGRSLGLNHRSDAGLVKLEGKPEDIAKLPYVEMGRVKDLKAGQWVAAMGENGGRKGWRKPPLRIGRLLRVPSSSFLTSDCTLSGGDSGGPLFDMQGRVIGINSKIGGNLASNLHVPIDAFHKEWERLLKGETIGSAPNSRTSRGRRRTPTYPAQNLGLTADPKVAGKAQVASVEAGSAAATAGVKPGDVIVGYKKKSGRLRKMRSAGALSRPIQGFAIGDELVLVVSRAGKQREVKLKLTARRARR